MEAPADEDQPPGKVRTAQHERLTLAALVVPGAHAAQLSIARHLAAPTVRLGPSRPSPGPIAGRQDHGARPGWPVKVRILSVDRELVGRERLDLVDVAELRLVVGHALSEGRGGHRVLQTRVGPAGRRGPRRPRPDARSRTPPRRSESPPSDDDRSTTNRRGCLRTAGLCRARPIREAINWRRERQPTSGPFGSASPGSRVPRPAEVSGLLKERR